MELISGDWLLNDQHMCNPPPGSQLPDQAYGLQTLGSSASSDGSIMDMLCGINADELLGTLLHTLVESPVASPSPPPAVPRHLLVDPAVQSHSAAEAAFRNIRAMEARNLQQLRCTGLKLPYDNAHLNAALRSVAVSWLIEVVSEFNLTQDTLFLSVALFDRFLQVSEPIPRHHAQLLAITCLYIASKVEEERFPSAALCVRIADGCFQARDVTRMEALILNTLQFNVHVPTALAFVRLLVQILGIGQAVEQRVLLMAELTLLDASLSSSPSCCTAAACVLAGLRQAGLHAFNCPPIGHLCTLMHCELTVLEPWVIAVDNLHYTLARDQDPDALHAPILEKYIGW